MTDSMIDDSVARVFSGHVDRAQIERAESGEFPQDLWELVRESGFDLALVSERNGGIGSTWSEAAGIFRGLGYWQVPLPLAETMIAAMLLDVAGIDRPEGPIALIDHSFSKSVKFGGSGVGTRCNGTATRVPWARHSACAVMSLDSGGIALFNLRDGDTIEIADANNAAGMPADSVTFNDAKVLARSEAVFPDLKRPVLALGAIARSLMMVGALERVLEQSAQYATERIQFGKPIGRNQAIQQQLALLAGDVASARVAALVAAADAPSSAQQKTRSTLFSAAVAKIRAGEAATRGTSIAHQVHGAIGFTHEHSLHFSTRRLWAWREEFGADAWWAQQLGDAAIRQGGAALWPSLTQREFTSGLLV